MASERQQSAWSSFIWGTVILAAGLIFWFDRLGRIDAHDWLEWWPVVFVAGAIADLGRQRWFGAILWSLAAAYFLLPMLGVEVPSLWRVIALWPLLFSVAGITLMVQTLRGGGDPGRFHAFSVMAGNHVALGSQEFRGGQALAVMGGCEIDLDAARNSDGEATIDVLAFWGGIDIRVPHGWTVVNRVAPILGGFEDKTAAGVPGSPRLIVRGASIMGGIEVKHRRDRGVVRAAGATG
jgi:hypothetical protein